MSDEVNTQAEQMIQEQSSSLSADPAEMAATLYTLYLPKMIALIDAMSGKGAKRVLKHLLVDKLIDNDLSHPNEAEKNAFFIGDRLLESKYVMILHTFAERAIMELEQSSKEETKENEENVSEATT